MRFEVPQFIEVEDKIVGPFTWKQFVYIGGGISFAVILFLTTPFIVALLFGLPFLCLAAALAFLPINRRPFSEMLSAIFNFLQKNRNYQWQKTETSIYSNDMGRAPLSETLKVANELTPTSPNEMQEISNLTRRLELE